MKPLRWMGSSLRDVREFPDEVRQTVGYALYLAQMGDKHARAKPMRGFGGAGVLEVADDFSGDTYRAVYTVTLPSAVYVLHAFQKKSRHGIATTQQDIALVHARLRDAQRLDRLVRDEGSTP